jgi:hypothetical protein
MGANFTPPATLPPESLGLILARHQLLSEAMQLKERGITLGLWDEVARSLGVRLKRERRGRPRGSRSEKQAREREDLWGWYQQEIAKTPTATDREIAERLPGQSRDAILARIAKIKAARRKSLLPPPYFAMAAARKGRGRPKKTEIRNKK